MFGAVSEIIRTFDTQINSAIPPPACPKSRNFELQSASCKALEGVEPADKALFGRAPPKKIFYFRWWLGKFFSLVMKLLLLC